MKKGLSAEVLATWRNPLRVTARRVASAREAQVLGWLMLAMLLAFVAGLPGLMRVAATGAEVPPPEALAAGRLLGGLIVAPLVFYLLAGLGLLALRLGGVRGVPGVQARAALFWALLAVMPAVLARAALDALLPGGLPALAAGALGLGILAVWLAFWGCGLRAAARQAAAR